MDGRHDAAGTRTLVYEGLDGLRTLAVLAVILSHQNLWQHGWVGVQLFFVLSGYLITGILFRARGAPLRSYLRTFYGRRVLRIFPLYYAYLGMLGLGVAFGALPRHLGERLWYAAAYLANHYTGDAAGNRLLLHFWSLAVEEQFYLVWPFLVYFCPKHLLRGVLVTLALSGIPIRYAVNFYFELPGYVAVSHVDAFALGALSALYPWRLGAWASRLGVIVAWSLGLTVLALNVPLPGGVYGWGYVVGVSLVNVASALMVESLVARQLLPGLFEHPLARYCGKISYGIYIFHFPMQAAVERLLPGAHVLVRLVAQISLTTALAALSFRFFESRFLALKERWFPSRRAEPVPARATVAA